MPLSGINIKFIKKKKKEKKRGVCRERLDKTFEVFFQALPERSEKLQLERPLLKPNTPDSLIKIRGFFFKRPISIASSTYM